MLLRLESFTVVESSWAILYLQGESECTSEIARGQLSIFGAVEDNGAQRISRIVTDQESAYRVVPTHWQHGIRMVDGVWKKKRRDPESRLCTEGAQEMQKGSG